MKSNISTELLVDLHVKFIQSLGEDRDLTYHLTTHLRMNAIYWAVTALCIMGRKEALDREQMIDFVLSCWDDEAGGFGSHPGHDAHLLSTLSAIQILTVQDAVDRMDVPRVVKFISSLQTPSGTFAGDHYGETDTRFSYCAINALSLLDMKYLAPGTAVIDVDKVIDHISRCRNFDGGFGSGIGAESHAGQVWVCLAALSILGRLDIVDEKTLGWWLAERQLPNGGLNGRPEKLEDVCYSFWVLSSLSILRKLHWINRDALISFILSAQDPDDGGIADRPGDMCDVFHTLFGIAGEFSPYSHRAESLTQYTGLSLLGYPDLQDIDPVYCMPARLIEEKGLKKTWLALPRHLS